MWCEHSHLISSQLNMTLGHGRSFRQIGYIRRWSGVGGVRKGDFENSERNPESKTRNRKLAHESKTRHLTETRTEIAKTPHETENWPKSKTYPKSATLRKSKTQRKSKTMQKSKTLPHRKLGPKSKTRDRKLASNRKLLLKSSTPDWKLTSNRKLRLKSKT